MNFIRNNPSWDVELSTTMVVKAVVLTVLCCPVQCLYPDNMLAMPAGSWLFRKHRDIMRFMGDRKPLWTRLAGEVMAE